MKISYLTASILAATTLLVSACGGDKAEAAAGGSAASAANSTSAASVSVTNKSPFEDKVSYAVGASVGTYISTIQREQGEYIGKLNQDVIIQGFVDALNNKTALSDQEISQTLVTLDNKVREGLEKKQAEEAQANLDAGQKYLDENAKKPGVKTTPSGLQYKVITEGKGKTPTAEDTVRVRYKGTTIDGKVFDEQTDPIAFPLSGIIPGWTEGLQLMKEGGKVQLVIPAALAYGETGAGDLIPPNSTLVFDIELVEVVSASESDEAETPAAE